MSTSTSTVTNNSADSRSESAAVSPARLFYWSVRRELWEYRSIYIAPLAAAGVFLFGFLISLIHPPSRVEGISVHDGDRLVALRHYDVAAGLIMITTLIVAVFYCLDALSGERRDRSILFWKSLPVSDLTTVVSKAFIPIVVLQLLAWAITSATQLIMLLLSSAVLAASGQSVAMLWSKVSFFQMSFMLLYHLLTMHALWYAPVYCWLLLVSAWARRAPFLWAILPPLAIGVVEKIAFNTMYFGNFIGYRLTGGMEVTGSSAPGRLPIDPGMEITPGHFLASPGLWLGLTAAAAFLYAAARIRRARGPI